LHGRADLIAAVLRGKKSEGEGADGVGRRKCWWVVGIVYLNWDFVVWLSGVDQFPGCHTERTEYRILLSNPPGVPCGPEFSQTIDDEI
jgi:hypothetical protein